MAEVTRAFFRGDDGLYRVQIGTNGGYFTSALYTIPQELIDGTQDIETVRMPMYAGIVKGWMESVVTREAKAITKKAPGITDELLGQIAAAVAAIKAQQKI
jgi:hypothetical protein